jgi:hypothetical protein
MMWTSQSQKEKALWMLTGERYPHGYVTGEFERKQYPSATQAVNAFLDQYPDLTSIRYHNTGDLLWYKDAPKERHFPKPFPDILR